MSSFWNFWMYNWPSLRTGLLKFSLLWRTKLLAPTEQSDNRWCWALLTHVNTLTLVRSKRGQTFFVKSLSSHFTLMFLLSVTSCSERTGIAAEHLFILVVLVKDCFTLWCSSACVHLQPQCCLMPFSVMLFLPFSSLMPIPSPATATSPQDTLKGGSSWEWSKCEPGKEIPEMRIPFHSLSHAHRAVSAVSDPRGVNFALLQILPRTW